MLSLLLRAPHIEIIAIIASTRHLKIKENKLTSDIERIKLSGFHYSLYLLLITQLYKFTPWLFKQASFESTCKKFKIKIISTSNINAPIIQKKIRHLDPDILFCAHFNQLIHPTTYNLAKESAVNLHPSLLPDLKGVDPAFYALNNSYNETGVTIHYLAEEFDTGTIVNQKKHAITLEDTLFSLNSKLFKLGTQLFIEHSSNKQTKINFFKNESKGHYDSWPTKCQVKSFKKKRNFILPPTS